MNMDVLCLDCGRIQPFTTARHEGRESCVCGGEFCGCDACAGVINKLRLGYTEHDETGLSGDFIGWTPQGGLVGFEKVPNEDREDLPF